MTQNLDDLIEQAKMLNRIEQVVGETPGFTVTGHGRNLTTREHDSLVIDTRNNSYFWNSADPSEHDFGDVIQWVAKRNGWDFKAAVEYLCKRAGLAAPEWSTGSPGKRMAARARQDIFDLAINVFAAWLWKTPDALAYARSRGWTDETIKRAQLGYTGDSKDREEIKDQIHSAIVNGGGDPLSLGGVALTGYSGDVRQFMFDNELEIDDRWVENGYIPSLIARDSLVYPHFYGGRCSYFSARRVHPSDKKKSYNLPVELVGEKMIYPNWEWSNQESLCVIVEGQADAITIAQWGLPAVALCGVHADEHLARYLGVGDDRRQVNFAIGLDADQAGAKNTKELANLFGPMTRMITWRGINGIDTFIDPTDGQERDVKDANDLLRGMLK